MTEQQERDIVEFARMRARATRSFCEACIEFGFAPPEALSLARARIANGGAIVQ